VFFRENNLCTFDHIQDKNYFMPKGISENNQRKLFNIFSSPAIIQCLEYTQKLQTVYVAKLSRLRLKA